MGASIFWQPVKGRSLNVGGRSAFVNALGLPREFDESKLEFLRGLAAGNEDFRDAVEELIDAIETHGNVRVWAEY